MKYTLNSLLQLIKPHFSPVIVPPEKLPALASIATQVPYSSLFALESYLGGDRVDLSQCFYAHERDALLSFINAHAHLQQAWAWQQLQHFCQQWQPDQITHLWLEYDLVDSQELLNLPGIFIALPPENAHLDWIEAFLAAFRGTPFSEALLSKLRACFEHLPPSATIYTLGVMLSRSIEAIRLPIHHIAATEIENYLQAIGWQGDPAPLAGAAQRYAPFCDWLTLGIDVGATIYPRLGLELHIQQQPIYEPRWENLFDLLVADGLCSQAERQAMLEWHGVHSLKTDPALFPENLKVQTLLMGKKPLVVRGLGHLKLVYLPGQPLTTKVYFGCKVEEFTGA